MPPHRAQLLLCHELIAGHLTNPRKRGKEQFCSLSAYAWCWDCDMYVCDQHLNANHRDRHAYVIEFPHPLRVSFE